MGVSIVICCYNSAVRITKTLEYVAAQQVPADVQWEVVIVDNASTDDTGSVASGLWDRLGKPVPLTIVTEPKKGINYARITGIKSAQYEYVLFCDDDNWLAADYVRVAFGIMSGDTSIGVCGGKGEAVFEAAEPSWFQQYKAVFACNAQADKEGYLDINHLGLYSAGMIIRRDAILRILASGYESEFEARSDSKLSGGEDFELVILIRTLGYKAYYSDRLTFRHFMPQSRMTWSYLKRIIKGTTVNLAPALVYSDTFRLLLTNDNKYKLSLWKDMARVLKSALSVKFSGFRDIEIAWIKLTGGITSVISNRNNYNRYRQKLQRLYELGHKGAE